MSELICKRCYKEYNNKTISPKFLLKDLDKYNLCPYCRKFKICKNCNIEFNHYQNQTCSKKCTQELKEKSWMASCGTKHNFYKSSKSRIDWENKLLDNEGIINVFQRESVKEKSKISTMERFGVDNISRSILIKSKKMKTLENTILLNSNQIKDKWHRTHRKFLETIGYDPRLHVFGKASQESLIIFNPLISWCLENQIQYDDIYLGIENKKEYFISSDKKIFFYDFTIRSKKIIIEFNGVMFHAKNEDIWYNPFTNESAFTNIKKHNFKKDVAIKQGFRVMEIWSDEDPIINIELCKKFIISNI